MLLRTCLFILAGFFLLPVVAQNTVVSGYVKDGTSGEPLLFATVHVPGTAIGATSNEYGFFSLTIEHSKISSEEITLQCNLMGYPTITYTIPKVAEHKLDVKMTETVYEAKTVEVVGNRSGMEKVNSAQMSAMRIPMKGINRIPSLGGETDIIKIVQLMPGVQRGGEGGTGMFVRGGTADQNLVLLDEATVYNIGHLFGFFSVFNSDALHDMTMTKGSFPAQYGGRLSSILDIRMKEGNVNKYHAAGGIGLLSSRLTIEGPIEQDTSSFMIAARRTYIDQMFKLVGGFLPYYFYDLNLKANRWMGPKDRIFFSSYFGNDVLRFDDNDVETDEADTTEQSPFGFGFRLGNFTNTLRWNHLYSDKIFSNLSLIHTKFDYDIFGKFDENNILIKSDVRDIGVKADVDYFRSDDHHIKFGGQLTQHIFKPNVVSTAGEISEFLESREGGALLSTEWALYAASEKDFKEGLWKLFTGIRTSGSFVSKKMYAGIEPRVAVRYMLDEFSSLKFGYSRMKQYMHLVSSSSVALPTDLWYPVTENIKPQRSDQLVLAYNRFLEKANLTIEAEAYYKWMQNLIEYREGANLILNDNFESELLQGRGDSWGFEFLVQRQEGRLNGWISYTLSWATRGFEELNGGETFWAKYDRRHNVSVVATYNLSKRWDFSAVWVYNTGSRFTAQVGQYVVPNSTFTGVDLIPVYTERNAVSMSPSHRLDINFVLKPRPDKPKKFKSEWHFGCYNFYNRAAPYRINVVPNTDGSLGYHYEQPGLFGFIPSVAYNFSF
ncbi:MAG: carboxypeptidase-like regulatory domain-containing protein [Flavobacteriales bacterium]|nr:carboxypeptidase-like regulatory domain-containing protein [Flavobacteriales bacterium]